MLLASLGGSDWLWKSRPQRHIKLGKTIKSKNEGKILSATLN